MPTFIILATADAGLVELWEKQIPQGSIALRLGSEGALLGPSPSLAAVVVLDAVAESTLPSSLHRCPTIFVGEPRSLPFEQARLAKRAKVYLSYEESVTRLQELLPLFEDVAEKTSMVELLTNKTRRFETTRTMQRALSPENGEIWDFLEGAVENIDTRDRLLAEFRRASRQILHASHAVFFLKEADGFRADRGTSFFPSDDPLVAFFESHPAVIDGTNWDCPSDPVGELAVRNRLALWGARLLVPVHDNARLLGLVALGVRDDGQLYDEADKTRAVFFARMLRHLLSKSAQLNRLNQIANQMMIGAKYLPGTLVLGPEETAPRHVPLVVRELIGRARKTREISRVAPSVGQPFRAKAGIIAETGGVWAFWEEASAEVYDAISKERSSRIAMLREIALTLNHELGNALVSLTTFRQVGNDRAMPSSLMQTVKGDVAQLEILNTNLAVMQSLHEAEPSEVDIREITQAIGQSLDVRVEVGAEPVVLLANKNLLEFALRAFIRAITENRIGQITGDLILKVRSTGSGADLTALISLKGRGLELEGILPEPTEDSVPNQGRISVFLAKEILHLHHGEIHAGPGIESVEILFSFKSL